MSDSYYSSHIRIVGEMRRCWSRLQDIDTDLKSCGITFIYCDGRHDNLDACQTLASNRNVSNSLISNALNLADERMHILSKIKFFNQIYLEAQATIVTACLIRAFGIDCARKVQSLVFYPAYHPNSHLISKLYSTEHYATDALRSVLAILYHNTARLPLRRRFIVTDHYSTPLQPPIYSSVLADFRLHRIFTPYRSSMAYDWLQQNHSFMNELERARAETRSDEDLTLEATFSPPLSPLFPIPDSIFDDDFSL